MLPEILVFLGIVFVIAVVLLWRGRTDGTGDLPSGPLGDRDRAEPALSSESSIGPNRSLGRTWRIDPGDRPGDADGKDI